ncbi:hypothetical protein Zmor_003355 [Zophobas morio]|uniref:Uncharacterized protein n=1 Tax=Zophobas morio TaxID=2755281 RepID=A0AA38HLB4_9CUCU|nr:hypothetical protein Zmor_003355 [Zophobas morio]
MQTASYYYRHSVGAGDRFRSTHNIRYAVAANNQQIRDPDPTESGPAAGRTSEGVRTSRPSQLNKGRGWATTVRKDPQVKRSAP